MDQKLQSRTERKKRRPQPHDRRGRVVSTASVSKVSPWSRSPKRWDIAKGTLYNYFPAKEAIINASSSLLSSAMMTASPACASCRIPARA